jgi:prepilin-type N-terminal cleavage/methylation domain-containing protein
MKKLNNKGFTLVELLAVIIILAIVVGISIPAITSVINNSKNSALGVATESAYDYLRDQYDIYNIDSSSASALVKKIITAENGTLPLTDAADLEALGYKSSNVVQVTAKVAHNPATNTAQICVTVDQIKTDGEYFITTYWNNSTGKLNTGVKNGEGVKNQAGNGC